MPPLPEGDVFTLDQVAKYLQVHVATVRKLIHEGKLIGFRVKRHYRVRRESLEAYVEEQERER